MRVRNALLLVLLWVAALAVAGCSHGPLVDELQVQPAVISPNADGVEDVARISYRLSRRATVAVYWLDEQGQRYAFREGVSRPPGEYEALFSGVIENRLLPDGKYTCVLDVP